MPKPTVLLIYTGGTIGMVQDSKSGDLKPVDFNHLFEYIPELHRMDVNIHTHTFPPIDSSNSSPKLWMELVQLIHQNYSRYDGFVILHGTDTITYTASALSFMLDGLNKPVILTGSQLPIGVLRTDGKENIITAIQIASDKDHNGTAIVQEVAIYFEYKLYRGNRSIKYSAHHFDAIQSPNYPPLAESGIHIEYHTSALWRNKKQDHLHIHTRLNQKISVLHLFPGIDFHMVKKQYDYIDLKALILRTYGTGNAPTDPYFLDWLKDLIHREILVLNVTQCLHGSVHLGKYETSKYLKDIGVVSAYDMTLEASITKMMYLLGKEKNVSDVRNKLTKNMRGEITEPSV